MIGFQYFSGALTDHDAGSHGVAGGYTRHDGSIMPRVTTGNTMAPCVMIGERAGEILKADHKL